MIMDEASLLSESVPPLQLPSNSALRCKDEVKKLESSLFNHISLGQWEAARACVGHLAAAEDQSTRENTRELLKILIVEAANYWSESVVIPSPHHLSWLALQAYKELFTDEKDKLPDYLQGLIEFRLLLFSCIGVVSFSTRVATQLCQYHAIHVLKIPGAVTDTVPHFSGLIVSFIHDVITTISPALGHTLITSLTVPNSSTHLANNESLQLIYIECINDCLELLTKLKNRDTPEPDSSYDSQYESDHPTTGVRSTQKSCEKIVAMVYTLLSLLDPSHDMIKLIKKIDTIFHTLLRSTYIVSADLKVSFETGRIYGCLLGRSTPFLINRLHEVEEYLRMHPDTEETVTSSLASTPKGRSLQLVPISEPASKEQWRGRFFEALYDHKHLLESTLESGLQLVLTGQLQELSAMMEQWECTPLRPIMLLMGWDKYPAAGSGKELLDILWPVEVSMKQQLLFNGCCKLAFQVELVQWCLEKAKPHLQHQSSFTVHRAGEMFKGLETHSTLFVLHHYTPLASLDPLEVIDILKMRPRVPLFSATAAVTPPPQFSRGTTPLKRMSESDSPPLLSPMDAQKSFPMLSLKSLRPEQERDISIFRSFCAIRLILDAVWTSVEISNSAQLEIRSGRSSADLAIIVEPKAAAARKLDFGSSSVEAMDTNTRPNHDHLHYSSDVIEKLQEAKLYISKIEPLNYRLEVLEDIFSLLFLTSTDIKPLSVSEAKETPANEDKEPKLEGSLPSRWSSEFSSAFSSVALIRSKAGFLIGERITSDLLLMLQDCINELRAAKFQQKTQQNTSLSSETKTSAVKSSIPATSLHQRSAQLEQYINEAKWRLQLVSSKSGIHATPLGKSGMEPTSSSDESASEPSESDSEDETKKERKRHKKPGITLSSAREDTDFKPSLRQASSLTNSLPSRQNGSISPISRTRTPSPILSTSLAAPRPFIRGTRPLSANASTKPKHSPCRSTESPLKQIEDDSGECADVEDRSPDSQISKKRKRLRSRSSQTSLHKRRGRLTDQSEGPIARSSFICQMLASPDSLLRMCVKHANYSKAKEVVKMFNMKGEFGEFFVDFSQQYELISQGLGQKSPSSSTRSSYSAPVSGSGSHSQTPPRGSSRDTVSIDTAAATSLSLQVAIRTATTSSETLESLHRLLAPSMVSRMLFSGDKALEKAAEESTLLQALTEHVSPLVMLDIVCSSKLDPKTAKRIVEEATSRSLGVLQGFNTKLGLGKRASRVSQTHDVLTVGGPFALLQLFSDIMGYFMNFGAVPAAPTLTTPTYSSPHTLLTSGGHQLQVESIVNSKSFADSYRDARERVERELIQFSLETKSELFEELAQCIPIEEPPSFSQRVKPSPVSVFDELIRALSGKPAVGSKDTSMSTEVGKVSGAVMSTSFLWQFVRYITKLLEFLTRCLGLGGASPTKASLLLTVLRESPSQVLGRLVFEQGIAPHRLETLMEDFSHLHVVEVIVKCCCPQLPSATTDVNRALPDMCSVIALNESSFETAVPEGVVTPDLCSFSHDLLSKLINIIKNSSLQSHSRDTVITTEDLVLVLENPELLTLLQKTRTLASVNLQTLDTPTKRMVFYSNIVNLLYTHAILLVVAVETGSAKLEGLEGVTALISGCGLTSEMIRTSSVIQSTYFTRVGYIIGQLGTISCFDLHHTVLRRGLTPPTLVKGTELSPSIKPIDPDPWAVHAPLTSDPRLVFVVHNGRLTSPCPVSLSVENLEDTLTLTETWYLSSEVIIDPKDKEISVPEWLFESCKDLVKNDQPASTDLSLLKYIHSKLDKEKGDILQPLIEASELSKSRKLTLTARPGAPKLGFNFTLKRSTASPKTSPKRTRKRPSRQSSRNAISPLPTPVVAEKKELKQKYCFTPEILAFVEQRAHLLAALVYLLSPPITAKTDKPSQGASEDKNEQQEEEMEASVPATGPMSLIQSIRSRVTRGSSPGPPTRKAVVTPEDKAGEDWEEIYDEVLLHFSSTKPMYQYLVSRLSCFNSLIQWDSTPDESPDSSKFNVCLRTLAALPSSSETVGDACSFVMSRLLEEGRVFEAVDFLGSEPASRHPVKVAFLSNMVLSCAFVANYLKSDGEKRSPLSLLAQISDPELASRLTLASLKHWPVSTCVDLLSYCHNHLQSTSLLPQAVKEMLDCMQIYSLIMASCKSPLHFSKSPWKKWYEIAKDSESRPDYVLRMLLNSKAFDVARQWASVHAVGEALSQQIEVEFLSHLLEGEAGDPIAAQQVLDNLSEDSTALSVCESLLEHANLQVTIFVLHYMLTRLSHCLHFAKTEEYSNKLLGARALLCLPENNRSHYIGLFMQPMLLVEQLLIDMKIEWASLVIEQLRTNEHLTHISKKDTPVLERKLVTFPDEEPESNDPFLTTIMFYCNKALEFPQPILVQNTPLQSMAVSVMSTRPPSPGGQLLTSVSIPIPVDKGSNTYGSSSYGGLDEQYPTVVTPRRPSYWRRASVSSPPPVEKKEGPFKPPPDPPTKEQWVKDSHVKSCPICKHVIFGMFSRRHHCRRCGRVVCSGCSAHLAEVKGYDVPVRVCNDCHKPLMSSDILSETPPTSSLPPFDYNALLPPSRKELTSSTLLPADARFNGDVRDKFYYERAPNTALFLSLVDLIVDKRVAAGFILDCCHTVSSQLVPNSQGLVNQEVDHHFVIGLIQNLLQNAKVRFAQAEDSAGVELCDTYLSRVDLLRLLISSRCPKIPSIQELTKPDLARRVRDKLMQSNRFKLAMEVSTKCQLDTGDVMTAWGMACLKYGDFQAARFKFKNCFQVSSHSKLSSSGAHNLQLLQRIVELIEQTPLAITAKSTQYNEDWSSVVMSSMSVPEKWSDECDLDKTRFRECVYYLTSYGSDSSLISFHVKHGCWLEACRLVKDKNCSTDLFIDHLWVPALKTGQIEYLEECLQRVDHTLSTWEGYLTAACRYFTQKGLFSVLYRTQLFMKDYIRAGMTCIKFFIGFSGRSTSISDLYSRLHYLSQAKKHFQTFLELNRRLGERRGGRPRSLRHYEDSSQVLLSSVKSLEPSEVQQHLATIDMQTRVTHFLYQSAEVMHTGSEPLSSLVGGADPTSSLGSVGGRSSQQPATLFSNSQVRGEVAIQLLTCSQDIIEGFDFAREVITAYRLSSNDVYCGTARALALKHKYGDLRVLLQCLQKAHMADALNNEAVMAAIKVLANQPKEAKQIDKMVQLLTSEKSKIKAFVLCGKLKNAYLVAVKAGEAEDVRHISELAGKAGQIQVRDICQKWLQEHAHHR